MEWPDGTGRAPLRLTGRGAGEGALPRPSDVPADRFGVDQAVRIGRASPELPEGLADRLGEGAQACRASPGRADGSRIEPRLAGVAARGPAESIGPGSERDLIEPAAEEPAPLVALGRFAGGGIGLGVDQEVIRSNPGTMRITAETNSSLISGPQLLRALPIHIP